MRVVGVDPGKEGAIACIDQRTGDATVEDLPLMTDKSAYWIDGLRLRDQLRVMAPNVVIVERVSTMPDQGVSSGFHFGMVFGSILSVVQSLQIRLELVTPVVWKRDLKLPGGKDKRASLDKARLLFPQVDLKLAKHHNRGEALLIALWYLTSQTRTMPSGIVTTTDEVSVMPLKDWLPEPLPWPPLASPRRRGGRGA